MNLLQLRAVGTHTRQNYAASLMKFEQWTNLQRRRVETDAEIDAAMSTWTEAEFYKKEVLRAWESGYSVLGWTSSSLSASMVPTSSRIPGGVSRAGSAFRLVARGSPGFERCGRGSRVVYRNKVSLPWDWW